jgi:hypothetical protein
LELVNAEVISDPDDGPVFWLALAQAQWECGALESDVQLKVEDIVQKGLGLDRWAEGAAPALQERRKSLSDFLLRIKTPPEVIRGRTPRKESPPVFAPGVCLSVQLPNGEFGAALVLRAKQENKEFGMNLVGLLAYRGKDKPALSVFESRGWLKTKRRGRFRTREVMWLHAQGFAESAHLFENAGSVKIRWLDPRDGKVSAPKWSIVPVIIHRTLSGTA